MTALHAVIVLASLGFLIAGLYESAQHRKHFRSESRCANVRRFRK